jgi:hypothetical protein
VLLQPFEGGKSGFKFRDARFKRFVGDRHVQTTVS